ncbi:MAG: low affinity iron permease family protein [Bacteroidetes bacterium]|nr:low affinity iron permease family protein [Bacteroidota bacterium]MBK7110094.1 low affinity iron permease family protein [Bacteroidota bacterium]MBK8680567.1 low affinity iron permease family protein [Bacteroidota bacterium]
MSFKFNRESPYEKLSSAVTKSTGSSAAFLIAGSSIIIWLVSGPFFSYSDTWQLVINTGTTIVTFLMVFLIQRSQNKESLATQLKLNELIASSHDASNRLIDVEDLTEDEMKALSKFYSELVKISKKDNNIFKSHSVEEADDARIKKINRKEEEDNEKESAKKEKSKSGENKSGNKTVASKNSTNTKTTNRKSRRTKK